jgi:hypothetical protein
MGNTRNKWWRGSISERFANIDNLVNRIMERLQDWPIPAELLYQLVVNRARLQALMNLCKTQAASSNDREQRKTLLHETVRLCRQEVCLWTYGLFSSGVMTASDFHTLGFLLPGESGIHLNNPGSAPEKSIYMHEQ